MQTLRGTRHAGPLQTRHVATAFPDPSIPPTALAAPPPACHAYPRNLYAGCGCLWQHSPTGTR
eukprot:8632997-Lingulodinium_polyedra.AAC.1